MGSKIGQSEILRQSLMMILKSKIKKEMSPFKWYRVLIDLHKKGWLYVMVENNEVTLVSAGYKIKDKSSKSLRIIPDKEEGDLFYVPFYVPKDRPLPRAAVKKFFRENKINRVIFEKDDDSVKEYKRR